MTKVLVVCVAFISLTSIGVNSSYDTVVDGPQLEPKIVGGVPAIQSYTRHQVSMRTIAYETSSNQGLRCGGSLITTKTVISAAHCVFDDEYRAILPSELRIYAGGLLLNQPSSTTQSRRVSKIIAHPNYDPAQFRDDVAILIVQQSFTLNSAIDPIALAPAGTAVAVGTACSTTGWGSLYYGIYSPASNQLMSVSVPILEIEQCNAMASYQGYLDQGMLCAGNYTHGGVDACQGDSGGPLVCNGLLTGVVSFGNECALALYPGVYANISFYRQWIDAYTESSATSLVLTTYLAPFVLFAISCLNYFIC